MNGISVTATLCTVMNAFETVTSRFLLPNNSLQLWTGAYVGMNAGLKLYGHADAI